MAQETDKGKIRALILVADGSEEIEFVTVYDVLVRAGVEVVSVGVELEDEGRGVARLSRNLRILPTHPSLSSLPPNPPSTFSILILPGGGPGAQTFSANPAVLSLISQFRKAEKWVAAICAGTTALVASAAQCGDAKVAVTSHPSVEGVVREAGWTYSEERVVVEGSARVLTSRGPGTALGWALAIVEVLVGAEKRAEIQGPMVVAEVL